MSALTNQVAWSLADALVGDMARRIADAMWAGDVETLDDLAPCRCCCHEHTFECCAARAWNGCRGSGAMTRADEESWKRHYMTHHGMSDDEFYGVVVGADAWPESEVRGTHE